MNRLPARSLAYRLSLVSLSLLAIAPCVRAAENAAVRRDILRLQDRFISATRKKDVNAVMTLLAPDFQQKALDGKVVDRQAAGELMRRSLPGVTHFGQWTLTLGPLKVNGNTAVAPVLEDMTVTIRDQQGLSTKKTVSMYHNTWVRTPGGWKYRRIEVIQQQVRLPGVEFVPPKVLAAASKRERMAREAKARAAERKLQKSPAGKAEARRILAGLYAQYQKDYRAKNAAAIMRNTAPNYTVVYPNMVMPRSKIEEGLKADLKATKSVRNWTLAIQAASFEGNTLVGTVKEQKTQVVTYPDGRTVTVNQRSTMRDTWVKSGNGWKNQKTEVLALQNTPS